MANVAPRAYHAKKTRAVSPWTRSRRFGSHFWAFSGSTRTERENTAASVQPYDSSASAPRSSGSSKPSGQLPGPNGAAMRVRDTTARTSGLAREAPTTPSDSHGHRGSGGSRMGSPGRTVALVPRTSDEGARAAHFTKHLMRSRMHAATHDVLFDGDEARGVESAPVSANGRLSSMARAVASDQRRVSSRLLHS